MIEVLAPDELAVRHPHAAREEHERRVALPVGLEQVHGLLEVGREQVTGISASIVMDLLPLRRRLRSPRPGKEGVAGTPASRLAAPC